jgi:parvulin-like peptidyl-prolyl isomerase
MKVTFSNTRTITAVFCAALILSGCAKHQAAVDGISPPASVTKAGARTIRVAKVNNVYLYMDALVNMMNHLTPKESVDSPEFLERHKKRSLDKLILQELAYQQAKAQGLSIAADKIEMAIKNLKENLGGEKAYADYLTKMHITEEDLRTEVERSLMLETIYYRQVLAKVTVPEDEVRQEYEKEKHLYIMPAKASIIDVAILRHDDNKSKASTKKANELLRIIKTDADKNPWNLILDGTFIVRDIDVSKDKEKELFEAAEKLKPNELSGVIEAPTGSHIIKLEKYSPVRQLVFDEVKSTIELKFKVPAQEKRMREWEQELRKDAKIEIIDSKT